ncbi:glutaredoxin 3 [Pseudomonas petrae]|uniref:Glutaredoxin n=1 Tax=Pseudomonas petrae TaxID=2912190 RepID=A0ABS9I1G4_9PSED|nr:glutaredoxin 3 [Pseudomonas petrae]MCF7532494.1 glutaredoxin 3 [Pseudomonas petrae]MCF7541648.1 glutaredoxin 3 [Pseudomonas petrae]MCF7557492.1 glutaredoxin 3 [Pseudomonas petrae]
MLTVTLYATATCPYCQAARRLLAKKGIQFNEIEVTSVEKRVEMINRSGRRTVPQIFFGNWHVGGYDDLAQLEEESGLKEALNSRVAY